MKTTTTLYSILLGGLAFLGTAATASAQSDNATDNHTVTVEIPVVALLDLEVATGTKNLTATFTQTAEAGEAITAPANDNTIWLNYSSIQNGTKDKRVDVSLETLVPGVDIKLSANAATTGAGTKGVPAGAQLTLTSSPQIIINGIGSAYTNTGASAGHQLIYSFAANTTNYGNLKSGTQTAVKVIYTLAEN